MTTDVFIEAIAGNLDRILHSNADLARLNLSKDIVQGWRQYVGTKSAAEMAVLVRGAAVGNRVPLDDYESKQDASGAAETLLYAVDGFYRKYVTKHN